MKKHYLKIIFLIFIFAWGLFIGGTQNAKAGSTYYVSVDGLNTNPGTETLPFRTIQKAADTVEAGGHVIVKPGFYNEDVEIMTSGEAGQPIVFEGERGQNGEWAVVDASEPVSGEWIKADEFESNNGVYKIKHDFEPFTMTVDDKDIPRIESANMISGHRGFESLNIHKDTIGAATSNTETIIKFWDGIEALFGYMDGWIYLRFREGDDPNEMNLFASPGCIYTQSCGDGKAFFIKDKSYVTIKGFYIKGSQEGIKIQGSSSHDNIIEDNYIINGQTKILFLSGPYSNIIRNNTMHMNGLSNFKPGAWQGADHVPDFDNYEYAVKEHIYHFSKYGLSDRKTSHQDEGGIRFLSAGGENVIDGNEIFNTLGGIMIYNTSGNVKISNNEIYNTCSIGIVFGHNIREGEISNNILYNNNVNLRFQNMQRSGREYYVYNNIIYNPEVAGGNIYFHVDSGGENISNKVYFYHNSFAGGSVSASTDISGANFSDINFFNNVFSLEGDLFRWSRDLEYGLISHNWLSGEGECTSPFYGECGPTCEVCEVNCRGNCQNNIDRAGEKMWDDLSIPDFTLPDNEYGNEARNSGIDLSVRQVIDGKTYGPFPGFSPGYAGVDGNPDMGYIRSGTPQTCTSFTYNCGACQPDNTKACTVASASPAGCTGGNPELIQSCTYEQGYGISDFIKLVADWLKNIFSVADINNDGVVNTRDLGIMMSNWNN